MLKYGIQPPFDILNKLVIDLTMNKFYTEALLPYQLIQKNGYFASDACHQAYIKSLSELGHVEPVVALAREWFERKNYSLMKSAVNALVTCKLPDQAWKLVEPILDSTKDCQMMMESIIEGYTFGLKQVEEAATIWQSTSSTVKTSAIMLHTLIRGYAIKANQDQVVRFIKEMNLQRVRPTLHTFVSLVMCHCAISEPQGRLAMQHLALSTLDVIKHAKFTH